MLYTIYPVETVMADSEEGEAKGAVMEIAWRNGAKLLVRPTGLQEGQLERVISSDPNDFLNPSLQPGARLRFRPEFMSAPPSS